MICTKGARSRRSWSRYTVTIASRYTTSSRTRQQLVRRDAVIVIAAILSVFIYVVVAQRVAGGPGFPLDDAWIHQTYGRNLALTGQWQFMPGIESAGSTSPLYSLLLAFGYSLHLPHFFWTHLLGALALTLAALVGAHMADRLFPTVRQAGLWTGLAIAGAWHLAWAASSGMETVLFAALCLVLISVACGTLDQSVDIRAQFPRGVAFGILAALLTATRLEGIVLVALLAILILLARPQPSQTLGLWFAGALVGGLLGIAPYALLNLHLNGTLVPNTFSAKQAENVELLAQPFLTNLAAMITPLTAGGEIFLLPGAVWAARQIIRRESFRGVLLNLALAIWPALLILLYALRLPAYYQHGRYVIPALPPVLVLGVGGTLSALQWVRHNRHMWARVLIPSLSLTALAVFIIFCVNGAYILGRDVTDINSYMLVAATWIKENVPPDQLLAVHDIGAVGYFAPRPILDLAGLVSPEVVPIIRNPDALMTLMQQRNGGYVLVLHKKRNANGEVARLNKKFNANGGMGEITIFELVLYLQCP